MPNGLLDIAAGAVVLIPLAAIIVYFAVLRRMRHDRRNEQIRKRLNEGNR